LRKPKKKKKMLRELELVFEKRLECPDKKGQRGIMGLETNRGQKKNLL
jgi:hypothetical protein